jgi:hypothetical protein
MSTWPFLGLLAWVCGLGAEVGGSAGLRWGLIGVVDGCWLCA